MSKVSDPSTGGPAGAPQGAGQGIVPAHANPEGPGAAPKRARKKLNSAPPTMPSPSWSRAGSKPGSVEVRPNDARSVLKSGPPAMPSLS